MSYTLCLLSCEPSLRSLTETWSFKYVVQYSYNLLNYHIFDMNVFFRICRNANVGPIPGFKRLSSDNCGSVFLLKFSKILCLCLFLYLPVHHSQSCWIFTASCAPHLRLGHPPPPQPPTLSSAVKLRPSVLIDTQSPFVLWFVQFKMYICFRFVTGYAKPYMEMKFKQPLEVKKSLW